MGNTALATTLPAARGEVPDLPGDVPGELDWFKPGTPEYSEWVDQRSKFLREIKPSEPPGRAILKDLVDALLKEEVPTGAFGAISMTLRITKRARAAREKRGVWGKVVWHVLQRTFTPPEEEEEEEFTLSFAQVQLIWLATDGRDVAFKEYRKLYAVVDTRLRAGPLKDAILQHPRLDEYTGIKLRKFKQSYLHFRSMIDQG